jgi:hypothetical protein
LGIAAINTVEAIAEIVDAELIDDKEHTSRVRN